MSPLRRAPVRPSRPRAEWSLSADASRRGRRFAEQERRARGRVDLHPMMHLDDLDIEIGSERRRRAPGQRREQVDAEAHVARPHDRGVARRRVDLVEIVVAEAGRADHVGDARLRGEPGELDARGGRGKIDDRVGFEQERQRVGDDRKAARRAAGQHGRVAAEPGRVRALEGAGQLEAFQLVDCPDDHASHAAGGAADDQPHLGHCVPLWLSPAAGRRSLR